MIEYCHFANLNRFRQRLSEAAESYHCGLNCVPLTTSVEVLTSSSSESDLIWRQGLCGGNQANENIRVGLNPICLLSL